MDYKKTIKRSSAEFQILLNRINRLDIAKNESTFMDFITIELAKFLWLIEKKTQKTIFKSQRDALDYIDGIIKIIDI